MGSFKLDWATDSYYILEIEMDGDYRLSLITELSRFYTERLFIF